MPRLLKTLIPRIKKSVSSRGFVAALLRAPRLPVHLYREYRHARYARRHPERSDFDARHGVETAGDIGRYTYLSDLDIPSPHWIDGTVYEGIEPERFSAMMRSLDLRFEDFVFIDFGSGKGRALLMASDFPFRRIVGVEFAPALHAIAERNIQRYSSPTQQCRVLDSVCMDFTAFPLPPAPSLLYLFHPTNERVLAEVLQNLRESLREHPRPVWIAYMSPVYERLFDSADFLSKRVRNDELGYSVYTSVSVR